jgi:hypothetical protein
MLQCGIGALLKDESKCIQIADRLLLRQRGIAR